MSDHPHAATAPLFDHMAEGEPLTSGDGAEMPEPCPGCGGVEIHEGGCEEWDPFGVAVDGADE